MLYLRVKNATVVYNNSPIKIVFEEALNRKSDGNCFPLYRNVSCLISTAAHSTEGIRYHHGANRRGNQIVQQNV